MDKEKAIEILEQAIDVATRKGIYSLQDMQIILKALSEIKK
jgi:hypothetical protein